MLFKLLKYDFRAMWKQFSLVWGAALALSLVHRMTHTLRFIVTVNTSIANSVFLWTRTTAQCISGTPSFQVYQCSPLWP